MGGQNPASYNVLDMRYGLIAAEGDKRFKKPKQTLLVVANISDSGAYRGQPKCRYFHKQEVVARSPLSNVQSLIRRKDSMQGSKLS